MTVEGNCRLYPSSTANAVADVKTDLQNVGINGILMNDHTAFWLTNMDTVAANVLWFRLDGTAATVGGNDCYPLRAGERVRVRKTDAINFIAAAGTPGLWIGGDQSGVVYS